MLSAGTCWMQKFGTGSAEITVIVHDRKLERKVDPEIGANVLKLE